MCHHRLPGNHISASLWLFWHSCLGCLFWLRFLEIIAKFTFCSHNHSSFSFSFLKREPVTSLERSKVLLIKTKLLLHYVWDFWGKEERAAFVNVTSQGKTYTNAFPLAKRWIPVGSVCKTRWRCWKTRWRCWEKSLKNYVLSRWKTRWESSCKPF